MLNMVLFLFYMLGGISVVVKKVIWFLLRIFGINYFSRLRGSQLEVIGKKLVKIVVL